MKKLIALIAALIAVTAPGATATSASGSRPTPRQAADPLFETISALDTAVFDAFNHCSSPEQLQKHASYFAPDVEFYHDTGGVTWSRQEMLANTEKHVCGNFRREASGKCDGISDFVIVWSNQKGQWQVTRVLSYGHRPNK